MSRLHDFERLVDERLRKLFRGTPPPGEKLEIIEVHRAILDEVAKHVESLPRGRRTFAYPHLTVRVLLPDPARKRSYEVAFIEGGALAREIAGRLAGEQAETPDRFQADVELVAELPPDIVGRGFDISYQSAPPGQLPATGTPAVWLKVLSGKAGRGEYSFRKNRINIGRLADITDAQQQLIRRNDVAFLESSDAPNPSISRCHAHIDYDAADQEFRLFDDRSAQGTTVLRDGAILPVPKGVSKGVRLQPGDEIVVGQARLSFDIHSEAETR